MQKLICHTDHYNEPAEVIILWLMYAPCGFFFRHDPLPWNYESVSLGCDKIG